jgi:IgGFc binding protein
MTAIRYTALVPALLLGGLAAAACSSSNRTTFDGPAPSLVSDGGTEAETPASCEGRRCSRDLHKVLDGCTDEVLEVCADDRGCREGACVPACDSAAAAQGSIGCSFWTTPPDVLKDSQASCFAAFVANTWNTPASITAEFGGDPIDISENVYRAIPNGGGPIKYERIDGPIPPGEVGIVFLSQSDETPDTRYHIACPLEVKAAYHGVLAKEHQTSLTKAFHLSTSVPVSAYEIFPYGGANSFVPSATLLLPSTSWSTSYVLVDGWRYQYRAGLGYPFVQVVAQEDTEVRLRPRVDVLDGVDVTGGPVNSVLTWNLKRGQVLQLMQPLSLGGSALEADKPVALFGGHQCANLPDEEAACDSLYQQIAPVQEWSSSYSAVPYRTRIRSIEGATQPPERVYWQIMAASDDTVLTYGPEQPVGAPDKLSAGLRAYFDTDKLFSVRSQDANHPIYLAVYMTGADRYATSGDPDYVNIVPDDQFLDHYVFFVDHTYADSTLTFVRRKDATGFHDVTLDCFGKVTEWQPLGTDGTIEYAWVEMTRNGFDMATPAGTCSHGRHEASSDGPFALYVWGMDDYASYGFPAGAGSRPTSPYKVEVR